MRILLFCLLLLSPLAANEGTRRALLSSIDPNSSSKYLAFYELYPNTAEGQEALTRAWRLLSGSGHATAVSLPSRDFVGQMVALINKDTQEQLKLLSDKDLAAIDRLAASLGNRRLKGFRARDSKTVLQLPPQQVDLARGLLLTEVEGESAERRILSYEALLDLMALQVQARLPKNATSEEKVRALSKLIFEDLQFQFPPHSEFAKDIDLYTFLPNVLDSRRGVCLGVSILYLCLAQRLELPLEIVTPPGHIYVRLNQGAGELNIETTHRGIHVDTEDYLSVGTTKLPLRNTKETIGFAHVNQASVYWSQGDYPKARSIYEKALAYLPSDPQLKELYSYSLFMTGDEEKAKRLLAEVKLQEPMYADRHDSLVYDVLEGCCDKEALAALFKQVDEKHASLEEKRASIEAALKRCPNFRSGWQQLGMTLLQLHRERAALEALKKYNAMVPDDPTCNYILCILHAKRLDYENAWFYFDRAYALAGNEPKALKNLKKQLHIIYPKD